MTGISGGVPPIKFDSAGNVLANLNAQNINPNVANPYTPQLLSHQTGLSYTPSTANTWGNMGASVTVPRSGILKVIVIGHTAGSGDFTLVVTRGSTTYSFNADIWGTFTNTTPQFTSLNGSNFFTIEVAVLANDVVQLQGTNANAGTATYADDLVMILQ